MRIGNYYDVDFDEIRMTVMKQMMTNLLSYNNNNNIDNN